MRSFKGEIILFITALIWGLAFIFQSEASSYIGAFTFNGFRFLLGAISLLPLLHFNRQNLDIKKCLKLGIILGLCIAFGSNLQQIAIKYTSAGKAGFVTSLYMVFVPIIGFIFFKKKISRYTIIGILIAIFGIYLLCNETSLSFEKADILLILCAIFFALQIVIIAEYGLDVNSVLLSLIQYLTAGSISMILALLFEDIEITNIINASSAILYTGILSTGIAYTLQIIGQRYTEPTIASLIMSLEALVSAIGGYFILHESLTLREIFGSIMMLVAVILAQIRVKEKRK